MNDATDEPIAGLGTLFVPAPGEAFWADLHARLVATSDPAAWLAGSEAERAIGDEIAVRDITSARSSSHRHSSGRRRAFAAAAVLVLVVAGLAAVRLGRDDEQRPADRVDLVIGDPLGIDLDDLRRDGLGWESEPRGPYQVFDFPALDPVEWTADGGGYDIADTSGAWDWSWGAAILNVANRPAAWQLDVVAPQTATLLLPDGEPVTVRGVAGVVTDDPEPEISWIERGTKVTLRWIRADAPFDLDESLGLADGLRPIDIAEMGLEWGGDGPFRRTDATPLGGRINDLEWWIDVAPDLDSGADEQVSIIVEGSVAASGGGPQGTPIRITSTMPFGVGRFYAGRIEGDLESVVVQLSDGTLITLPVHDEGDTTLWAVPIPIGLDVVQLQFVEPGGTDVTTNLVPIHLDQVGAVVSPS